MIFERSVSGLHTESNTSSPNAQLRYVHRLNAILGLGFSDGHFCTAEKLTPRPVNIPSVLLTLVPYLSGNGLGKEGLEATFQTLWLLAVMEQPILPRWEDFGSTGPSRLGLLSGLDHTPGLRWEMIDFRRQNDCSVIMIQDIPARCPHAGILASLIFHKQWRKTAPDLWLPGYVVRPSEDAVEAQTPYIRFVHNREHIDLIHRRNKYDSAAVVPVFFQP